MQRILLLGKIGQLGWELQRTLAPLGTVLALDYPEIDLKNPLTLEAFAREFSPGVIVNATAYTAVDRAESEIESAMAINGHAPGVLAEIARKQNSVLIHYSTDYVFDGAKSSPYVETDATNPLGAYGRTKLAGEKAIQQIGGAYLIFRTSWVYSLRRDSFVTKILGWARQNPTLCVVTDQVSNPTWARMLAEITAQILAIADTKNNKDKASADRAKPPHVTFDWIHERQGVYHLAGSGFTNRYAWAQAILRLDPHPEEQITREILPARTSDFPAPAQRPLFSALNCERFTQTFGLSLPDWQEALRLAMET